MSNSLAIATVTATLQNMLLRGATSDLPAALVTELGLGNTRVTAAPLDRARTPNNNVNQLNLCLFQATPSAALRNLDLAPRSPVALELHYLVTAYGGNDDDRAAHVLLGQAARTLNDRSLLTDFQTIRDILRGNDLADAIDHVRISPRPLTLEDLSRVFSMYQAPARISLAYLVGVVLIDSTAPRTSPLPVLRRRLDVAPAVAGPALFDVAAPQGRLFMQLGDALQLSGQQLRAGATLVRLTHARLAAPVDLVPSVASAEQVQVAVPNNPAVLPAGSYGVSVVLRDGAITRTTNTLLVALAPQVTLPNAAIARVGGTATITIGVRPSVLPTQRVALILGDREVDAPARAAAVNQLTFQVPNAAVGAHFVRLRVDDVESDLLTRATPPPDPPTFDLTRRVTIT